MKKEYRKIVYAIIGLIICGIVLYDPVTASKPIPAISITFLKSTFNMLMSGFNKIQPVIPTFIDFN